MKNLDLIAAQTGQNIITGTKGKKCEATNVENLVTKALGVLQENGVYASMLYLYSRSNAIERPIAEECRSNLLLILSELNLKVAPRPNASIALKFLTDNVCSNLDRLLLVKQLWEQTLIYTRYGAKAWNAEKSQEPQPQVQQEVKPQEEQKEKAVEESKS